MQHNMIWIFTLTLCHYSYDNKTKWTLKRNKTEVRYALLSPNRFGLPWHGPSMLSRSGHSGAGLSSFTLPSWWEVVVKRFGSIQRSPQHRKVHFTESRVPAQLPVRVVAHPRVIVGLPVDTAQIPQWSMRLEWSSYINYMTQHQFTEYMTTIRN